MSSAHATARRAELFDQLVELVLAEGFADLTIDACATRLHCSKSTLYALASSREQLITASVVHFFRRSAEQRLGRYLSAVADELRPASAAFYTDVAAFVPAREVYERNTVLAARRVQQLITKGIEGGAFRSVNGAFIADVTSSMMVRIQRRQVAAATGLADAQAYRELAELILHGILK
jgi:AcrR family transcriptional regulator